MHIPFITLLALVATAIQAAPAADPEAQPEPDLVKRADNWCKVASKSYCRLGPTRETSPKPGREFIYTTDRFGVRCKRRGETVSGSDVWDWIPGWGCYVHSSLTRTAGTQAQCETGLGFC